MVPQACPLRRLEAKGGKLGPLSTSEAFQTLLGPLVINENLTSCFQGWSQGFGESVAATPVSGDCCTV